MNKLTENEFDVLTRATSVARALQIEAFAITEGVVKGVSNSGMLIVDEYPDPDFNIGVTRVQALHTRLAMIAESGNGVTAEYTKDKTDTYINKIFLKSKRTKVEFNCAKPELIKAPKRLADKKIAAFTITPSTLATLKRAASAMGSTLLSFSIDETSVVVRLKDDGGDIFEHTIDDSSIETTEFYEQPGTFVYNIKNFLQTLKDTGENGKVEVTVRGFLACKYDGFTVYLTQEII